MKRPDWRPFLALRINRRLAAGAGESPREAHDSKGQTSVKYAADEPKAYPIIKYLIPIPFHKQIAAIDSDSG